MISKRVRNLLRSRATYPLAREYDVKTPGTINLASNESPYGPSPRVIQALKREATRAGLYPDPRATRLKSAISDYVGVGAKCVTIGNGSDELMELACRAFLDPGDRALIPLPTFAMYELVCRENGGIPKFFSLPNFEWKAGEIKRLLRGVKLVFLGRPNNPTGNGMNRKEMRDLMKVGKLIITDEAYVEFDGDSVADLAPKSKNLLVLRTFSKAFGLAGLRIGYAIGNPKIIEVLESIRAPFNVNRMAQVAAIAALEDMSYLRKVVNAIRKERKYLRRELSKLGLRVLPSDANFLMVNVRPLKTDAPKLCDYLARRGILIRDLSNFRGAGPNWVRITVGKPEQNKKLLNAIKQFKGGA
ncbi:MAG: histidinol-phosphate transaminase [Hadesarchaea archaeon]|nr:MAG: histidinol-phosphate transaminase [Hadesarchaea archaeon]